MSTRIRLGAYWTQIWVKAGPGSGKELQSGSPRVPKLQSGMTLW